MRPSISPEEVSRLHDRMRGDHQIRKDLHPQRRQRGSSPAALTNNYALDSFCRNHFNPTCGGHNHGHDRTSHTTRSSTIGHPYATATRAEAQASTANDLSTAHPGAVLGLDGNHRQVLVLTLAALDAGDAPAGLGSLKRSCPRSRSTSHRVKSPDRLGRASPAIEPLRGPEPRPRGPTPDNTGRSR